jgi:hypothetical protein
LRARYEIADLLNKNRNHFLNHSSYKNKIINSLIDCRTSKLGGYVYECSNERCLRQEQAYNSCRNRHCPKCQYRTQQKWVKSRADELLPVNYFHMVWSVPHELNELFLLNREKLSNLLFTSSSYALKKLMKDEYDCFCGSVSVMHTWGSNLSLHPHVHSIVPAGGLSLDKTKWISSKKSFLLHVKSLSKIFKAIYLKRLKMLHKKGDIFLGSRLGHLEHESSFLDYLDALYKKEWVVYSKKSFKKEVHVLKYLGRYTHRIAINNHRILDVSDNKVCFSVKDYRNQGKKKELKLSEIEFLRRFLLHIVPLGFMRVRHNGFLGNRYKAKNLSLIRSLLPRQIELSEETLKEINKIVLSLELPIVCCKCKCGRMIAVDEIKKNEIKVDTS